MTYYGPAVSQACRTLWQRDVGKVHCESRVTWRLFIRLCLTRLKVSGIASPHPPLTHSEADGSNRSAHRLMFALDSHLIKK